MRVLLWVALMAWPLNRMSACTCAGHGTPCSGAGSAAAVFTATVLEIEDPVWPHPAAATTGAVPANRSLADHSPVRRPLRIVRMRVQEVLSGIAAGQKQVEIATGMGGGDCGFAFQTGVEYVVYAYRNSEGRLETGICSRTRRLSEAAEDVAYIRAMANAPETGELRVRTALGNTPGKSGATIIAERAGSRHAALTNAAGEAVFAGLPPGSYTIHAQSDGDLPDDPTVDVRPKGCVDVTLFRALRINGSVTTSSGQPAARIEVQLRSVDGVPSENSMTGPDGRYQLRILTPGRYYLGINLNHTATRETPYPRWFHPGVADPAAATVIAFSGHPEVRSYDLALPERLPERAVDGIVTRSDGQPMERAVVTILDASRTVVAQAIADQGGRFSARVFAGTAYRLHAVWPGSTNEQSASAVPIDIPPGTAPLSLRLALTQPGNSFLDESRQRNGSAR